MVQLDDMSILVERGCHAEPFVSSQSSSSRAATMGTRCRRTCSSSGRITSPWVHSTEPSNDGHSLWSMSITEPSGPKRSECSISSWRCAASGCSVCTHRFVELAMRR